MSVLESKIDNHVLRIELTRDEVHNALNPELMREMTALMKQPIGNPEIRAVFIKGRGKSLCAGADINWMRDSMNASKEDVIRDSTLLTDMYDSIWNCPVPVIAYAHGAVMGGGVGLVATCDIVAAENKTRFCFSELKLGIVAGVISTFIMQKVTKAKYSPLMLTAEIFDANKCFDLGLAHFVGDERECLEHIETRIKYILSNGPEATRAAKTVLRKFTDMTWNQMHHAALDLLAERRQSEEAQEGMKAFFEKRDPSWRIKV